MEKKDDTTAIRLINQSLNAAASSINLARQLLSELSGVKNIPSPGLSRGAPPPKTSDVAVNVNQLPGVIGIFDGQFMVADDGQKYQIPENYASKSMIVFGDKLKMVDVNGEKKFKQIERTKRQRASGMIVKKEGRHHVVTSDGSYRVSSAAVSFFGGQEGDEAHIILPLNNKHVPFAALESVGLKKPAEVTVTPVSPVNISVEKKELTTELAENPKEMMSDTGRKGIPSPKKPTKILKVKERKIVEKSDEKLKSAGEVETEKIAEKPNTPLIGDDELR